MMSMEFRPIKMCVISQVILSNINLLRHILFRRTAELRFISTLVYLRLSSKFAQCKYKALLLNQTIQPYIKFIIICQICSKDLVVDNDELLKNVQNFAVSLP